MDFLTAYLMIGLVIDPDGAAVAGQPGAQELEHRGYLLGGGFVICAWAGFGLTPKGLLGANGCW